MPAIISFLGSAKGLEIASFQEMVALLPAIISFHAMRGLEIASFQEMVALLPAIIT